MLVLAGLEQMIAGAMWPRRLLTKLDFEAMKFSLLFLGMVDPASVPEDPKDRVRLWSAHVHIHRCLCMGVKPHLNVMLSTVQYQHYAQKQMSAR